MKERGIPFSGEMVKALLAGTKTQTRRIMKPQPNAEHEKVAECYSLILGRTCHESQGYAMFQDENGIGYEIRCPYGAPGDRLYVRENYAVAPQYDKVKPKDLPRCPVWYVSDDVWLIWASPSQTIRVPGRTRVSIHMMKWMSRIHLEILKVRVERLQDIPPSDAEAEGIARDLGSGIKRYDENMVYEYEKLWGSLHGAGSWERNEWVWVLEFRKL